MGTTSVDEPDLVQVLAELKALALIRRIVVGKLTHAQLMALPEDEKPGARRAAVLATPPSGPIFAYPSKRGVRLYRAFRIFVKNLNTKFSDDGRDGRNFSYPLG